jgi:pyridoxal 5-phosphate dependent beta-lyase
VHLTALAQRLPPPDWDLPLTVLQRLETAKPMSLRAWGIRSRSANTWRPNGPLHPHGAGPCGRLARRRTDRLWPTAITTLTPLDGADPQKVRSWLIAERGIVTTSAEVQRAPFELHAPVLVSPHVDSAIEDLEAFAEALAEATELLS